MSAEPVHAQEWNDLVREALALLRALDAREPTELSALLRSRALHGDTRRAVEALVVLQAAEQRPASALLQWLTLSYRGREGSRPDIVGGDMALEVKQATAARKVSVSMPEDLTAAVQRRVGRGKFSQYVSEAVSRQLEMDLLAELAALLAAEHGPVPEEYLAEARAAWPDDE